MRMAGDIQPCIFLEADTIDDQSITVPFADRISEPRRLGLVRQGPSIRENLPVIVISLEEHDDKAAILDDLARRDVAVGIRHAVRETSPVRPILAVVFLPFLVNLLSPWLHQDFNAICAQVGEIFGVGSSPDPRKIRRAIRQLGRGSLQVGFSVSRARSTRIGVIHPLCIGWNAYRDKTEGQGKSMKHSHWPSLKQNLEPGLI